jgi:hypothetical protein
MALALSTVQDYIGDVRTLLQDVIAPYRYADAELIVALNVTILNTRRLRPDLFLNDGTTTFLDNIPQFTAVNSDAVPIEPGFRLALVHGICGHALERDQEDVQDQRASAFLQLYREQLLGLGA